MRWLLAPLALFVGALAYGVTRKPRTEPISQEPGDPGTTVPITVMTQLTPGTKIRVDGDKLGIVQSGNFLMRVTEQLGNGDVKATSIDSRLPNNPLGIGSNPIPVPRTAITGVAV